MLKILVQHVGFADRYNNKGFAGMLLFAVQHAFSIEMGRFGVIWADFGDYWCENGGVLGRFW
ncbi:MAG: hypothetical protein K0U66_07415 [Gammaproteobacteria bacterium]|nr:hypothetical protein [Gammaproteobacteria bacterium]